MKEHLDMNSRVSALSNFGIFISRLVRISDKALVRRPRKRFWQTFSTVAHRPQRRFPRLHRPSRPHTARSGHLSKKSEKRVSTLLDALFWVDAVPITRSSRTPSLACQWTASTFGVAVECGHQSWFAHTHTHSLSRPRVSLE